jgi:DNA (cytosine-5)-methyltransferase 1
MATLVRPLAIDLFSGCGGLSLGLQQAGFRVAAAVEIDARAQTTYALNHPRVALYKADIQQVCPKRMLRDLGLRRGAVDLLAGCPPCQGFSKLRTMNKSASVADARNNLVTEFLRFVEVIFPKTVMLENVPALRDDKRFGSLRRRLSSLGYQCVVHVLDAADYGVPQRRKRLILLASRVHVPALGKTRAQRLSVRNAIAHLAPPSRTADALHALPERRSAAVAALIQRIPKDGGSRMDLPAKDQLACHKRASGFFDVYGRMAWDDVALTITSGCTNPSKGRFLHPARNRAITLREAALLQGFPESYRFEVSHGKEAIALMIGNALPPPFIAAHAKSLMQGLRG